MRYIPFEALKILAIFLHGFFSLILPKYSKHGQRKMTIPQKMTILTLGKGLGYSYRDLPWLAYDLKDILGIKEVTCFQNFDRFEKTIKPHAVQDAIELSAAIVISLDKGDERVMLVDSTGFQIMDASTYYNYRAQRSADFFKLHVVMDRNTKVVVLATPSDRYYHDVNPMRYYFIDELAKLAVNLGFEIKIVSADSAYAANEVYQGIIGKLKATPAIKPSKRRSKPKNGLVAVFWRLRNVPWFRAYSNLRWILEAMFKVFKRLFGGYVRGKGNRSRANEVLFKVLAWNITVLILALAKPT